MRAHQELAARVLLQQSIAASAELTLLPRQPHPFCTETINRRDSGRSGSRRLSCEHGLAQAVTRERGQTQAQAQYSNLGRT